MSIRSAYRENLMDKPSAMHDYCVVCGRYCIEGHHVVQKGIGGVKKHIDKRIPRIGLCRFCHKEVHAKRLHLQWDGKWLWFWCRNPMKDEEAWEQFKSHYSPIKRPVEYVTYGAKK